MDETIDYTCPHCGEAILLAIDPTGGASQEYVEDCPVCCNPNRLRIWFDREGEATIDAQPAQ